MGVLVGTHNKPDASGDEPEPITQVSVHKPNENEPLSMIEKLVIQEMYQNEAINILSKLKKS